MAIDQVQGVQLSSMMMWAPGTFVYLARGPYIYEVLPLGEYSDHMLASMTFLP